MTVQTYTLYREMGDDGKTKLYLECSCSTDILETTKAVKVVEKKIEVIHAETTPEFNPHHYAILVLGRLRVHFAEINEIKELYYRHKGGEQPYAFISGWAVPKEPDVLVGLYSIEFGYGVEGDKRFREASLPRFGIIEKDWNAYFGRITNPPKDDPESEPKVQGPYHYIVSDVSHIEDPRKSSICINMAGFRWEEIPEPAPFSSDKLTP